VTADWPAYGEPRCDHRNPGTKDENGNPYWPRCDMRPGHDGDHHSGHWQDVMWVWGDE
jgi:hypothetical protein